MKGTCAVKGTIKRNDDIERLFRTGRRSSSYLMTILVKTFDHASYEGGRCAYIAGKKLGSAPLRSRCKRVLRANSRLFGAPWSGYDVAFIASRSLAHEKQKKVQKIMKQQLVELGIVK